MKTSGLKDCIGEKIDGEPVKNNVVIVTIIKPKLSDDGVKIRRMRVVLKFVCKMLEAPYFEDENIFQTIVPDESCDVVWFKDNIFRFVDIEATLGAADERVNKIVDLYKEKDADGTHKVTIGIVRYYAQNMYLLMSTWGDKDGQ